MTSVKLLLEAWRSYERVLNESQLYGQDAANFLSYAFNTAASTQSNDRTDLSFEDFVREVVLAVSKSREMNKKLFVSFVEEYEDDKTPELGVSPYVTYRTPHGVYGYPLDNKNVYRLLTTGSPTSASFAIDRDYMHLYTISDIDMISIDPSKKKPTDYDNRKFDRDIDTMTKMIVRFLLRIIDNDVFDEETAFEAENPSGGLKKLIDSGLVDLDSLSSNHEEEVYYLFTSYIYYLYRIENLSETAIVKKVKEAAFELSNTDSNMFASEAINENFYNLYFIARLYANLPELADGKGYNHADAGAIYSLLLNGVGINAIDDSKGSSTIHRNEPSQSVVIDLSKASGENRGYNLIGTYLSPEAYFRKKAGSRQVDKVIDEMLANSEISIDDVYPPNFDYNLSKRHADNDIVDMKTDDVLQHVAATVRPGAESIVNGHDSKLSALIGDFNNEEYLKLSDTFDKIFKDLNEYCDNANEQYRGILIEKGVNENIINHILNPNKYLDKFFTKVMYSTGFFILDKKEIEKKITQNNLFQSLESKINFVKFLKVIHDSIMSSKDIDKNTYMIRKKFINILIEIFNVNISLVENRKTKSIKNVYIDLFD